MTCIAAVTDGTTVTMGADSAGVAGTDLTVRADSKVFQSGPFLMGFAGSFRMGQLLRYSLTPPGIAENDDLMRYMVCDFIQAVRKCLEAGGALQKDKQVETAQGLFLVGLRGHVFRIDNDYQVGESAEEYEAIGSGHTYARGSLHTSGNIDWTAKVRVWHALNVAAHLNGTICPPFTILSST